MSAMLLAAGLAVAVMTRPPIQVDAGPVMYLTTHEPVYALIFDAQGNGEGLFFIPAGSTVQASMYVIVGGVEWLYVHQDGDTGWVLWDYDSMAVGFSYDEYVQ